MAERRASAVLPVWGPDEALGFVLRCMLRHDACAFTCAFHACMRARVQGDFEALVRGRLGARGVRAAFVEGILAMCRADPEKRPTAPDTLAAMFRTINMTFSSRWSALATIIEL